MIGKAFIIGAVALLSTSANAATIINGGITAFDPNGTVEHVPVPDLVVTNICFGGDDMRTAWITASSTGKLYRAKWPRPGLKLNYNG